MFSRAIITRFKGTAGSPGGLAVLAGRETDVAVSAGHAVAAGRDRAGDSKGSRAGDMCSECHAVPRRAPQWRGEAGGSRWQPGGHLHGLPWHSRIGRGR